MMQKTHGIKWGLVAAMLILALCLCGACASARMRTTDYGIGTDNNGTRVIEGYIVDYDGQNVTIDPVEFLTASHTSRINELGLDRNNDFRSGYYIHNDGARDQETYPLATNAQVRLAQGTAGGATYDVKRDGYTGNYTSGYTANNAGTGTTVNSTGRALGGIAGGVLGGVDMLSSRFQNGVTASATTPYFITIENGYVTNIEEVSAYSNFAGTQNLGMGNPAIGK